MAVYIDTEQVAGIAGIPSLTLEQYNALEVKPKLWFLLNPPEEYQRLSADEVSYDGTNSGLSSTDTQGAIDEVNGNVNNIARDDSVWALLHDQINIKRVINMGSNKTLTLNFNSECFGLIIGSAAGNMSFMALVGAGVNKILENTSGWTSTSSGNTVTIKSASNWGRYVILAYGEFTYTTSA